MLSSKCLKQISNSTSIFNLVLIYLDIACATNIPGVVMTDKGQMW